MPVLAAALLAALLIGCLPWHGFVFKMGWVGTNAVPVTVNVIISTNAPVK